MEERDEKTHKKCVVKIRYILAFMGFLAFICMSSLRVNLSVAIVAMVKKTKRAPDDVTEICPVPTDELNQYNSTTNSEFVWNEKTQGLILGSFYYFYGCANIIGGRASEYLGGRVVAGWGIVLSGILTLLSPWAARTSVGFLIALRVLEGFFQGLAFPAMYTLIAKWYTTQERSKFTSFIMAGQDFGNVISLSVSGWLCASDIFGGWQSVFYLPGVLSVIWGIFWFILIRDDPKNHPRISQEELQYIKNGCPNIMERLPVPWVYIFTSRCFWTIVLTQLGNNWGYFILLTELPTYLDKILHVKIENNGLISATPYLATWIFSVIYSILIDRAIARRDLSILSVRRVSMAIAGYGPMLCMIGMCFVNCNGGLAFAIFLLSGAFNGAAFCGFFSSHADIAPQFAGTLMGLSNAIGSIASFTGPALTGIIIEENQTISAWKIVFLTCALMYGVSTTIYEFFITTKQQPWNNQMKKYKGEKSSVQENSSIILNFEDRKAGLIP